ncbi:hypothetical protein BCV69DRAFT_129123 [Microstroma glucosiphilum]|uniref:Uncharacterized protein n=1 Tax=Pseudomicrostroma glucosiphilum TaxID=1684307 RepID=A0A316TVY0_9BASI|nr:hypothetical protein BCV69DRAFT_129123 [Pseudomicrostroma glucosiphilum]PWN17686.1 hypothetical protein BCV69DRAFT_129123 [Pseudomicrostroma glucosiphilum]
MRGIDVVGHASFHHHPHPRRASRRRYLSIRSPAHTTSREPFTQLRISVASNTTSETLVRAAEKVARMNWQSRPGSKYCTVVYIGTVESNRLHTRSCTVQCEHESSIRLFGKRSDPRKGWAHIVCDATTVPTILRSTFGGYRREEGGGKSRATAPHCTVSQQMSSLIWAS